MSNPRSRPAIAHIAVTSRVIFLSSSIEGNRLSFLPCLSFSTEVTTVFFNVTDGVKRHRDVEHSEFEGVDGDYRVIEEAIKQYG